MKCYEIKRHDIQAGDLMDMNSGGTNVEGASALDADTTAAGDNMVMLTNPEEVMHFVDVAPFSADYAPIPFATCATAWTNPDTLGTSFSKA